MNSTGTGRIYILVLYCILKITEAMSGEGRDLMEVNGDSLAVEERRTLQGETIPLFNQTLEMMVLESLFSCRRKKKLQYIDPCRLCGVI